MIVKVNEHHFGRLLAFKMRLGRRHGNGSAVLVRTPQCGAQRRKKRTVIRLLGDAKLLHVCEIVPEQILFIYDTIFPVPNRAHRNLE
jgi:hypothetical protein